MVLAAVLATIALGILLRGLMILIWSAQQQFPARRWGLSTRLCCCRAVAAFRLLRRRSVAANALTYAALFFVSRYGRWGVRTRAAGQNPLFAAQRGINLHAIYALAWALSPP